MTANRRLLFGCEREPPYCSHSPAQSDCRDQIRMNAKWRKMDLNHLLQFHYNAMRMAEMVASEIFFDFFLPASTISLSPSSYLLSMFTSHTLAKYCRRHFNDDHIHIFICERARTLERLHGLAVSLHSCFEIDGKRRGKQTGINSEVVPWLNNNPAKSTLFVWLVGSAIG